MGRWAPDGSPDIARSLPRTSSRQRRNGCSIKQYVMTAANDDSTMRIAVVATLCRAAEPHGIATRRTMKRATIPFKN